MRRRLALVTLAVVSLVVLAGVISLASLLRNQAENRALRGGETDAEAIAIALGVAATPDAEGRVVVTTDLAERVHAAFAGRSGVSIVFPDGSVVGSTIDIGPAIEEARTGQSGRVSVDGGVAFYVPVFTPDATAEERLVVVRKLVSDEELTQGVAAAWLLTGGLGVFLIVVAVVAADRLGRSMVRPVGELAAAARSLGDGALETRVKPEGPEEIADVGEAINFLAGQLDALLAAERESVADLSHRLRTPLTALRLQAETMAGSEEAASLLADVDRMEQAVNRMIMEARDPSPEPLGAAPKCDLGAIVRHRATFWKVLADEQQRLAEVITTGGVLLVETTSDELGAVVDTLLANVFSHTEPGVGYRITAQAGESGSSMLIVEDDGPGFPDPSVLERGTSGSGSTGLGLDIARRVAEETGGSIALRNRPGGGARIEVVFGAVPSPSKPDAQSQQEPTSQLTE